MRSEFAGTGAPRAGRAVVVRAPAKVNLHLEVLRRRPDGYHEIETVFQAVRLFDSVRAELRERRPGGEPRIELAVTPAGSAPRDARNLCWRAARLFCHKQRVSGRIAIDLEKEIPSGAGLGGGSSDAAAVLVALDRLFGTDLEIRRLERLAAELGADVPFFIRGGTALGRGVGAELTALPRIRTGIFVIAKPAFELATADVYETLKMGLTVRSPIVNIRTVSALIARFPTSSWFGYNRLESVVLPSHPALQRVVVQLRELAPIAMLCGSGSALFGVFDDESEAGRSAEDLDRSHPFVRRVGPHPGGVEIVAT
jgi:4-diphosphocytidyl-2-C-methyl-D-erythritol kinase